MRFDGKVLVATGAGSGLGEGVVRRFAAEGGRVAVLDLDGERAEQVAGELPGSIGAACDVADEDSVAAAFARAQEELGGVHGVITAAGYSDIGPLEDWTLERWNRLMGVHMTGTFLTIKHAIPLLRAAGGGSIVTFSSVEARRVAREADSPYAATKAGISGFSLQLAAELAPEIRVNAIAPGRMITPMTVPVFTARGDGDLELGIKRTLEMVRIPAGRLGSIEDVAASVCFLLSEEASFITGQTIYQDGGESLY